MHRTGRSIVNFATGIILQVITLGIGFVSTPLLLSWLGNERYGAFRAASDWGNYTSLLELGIGGSLMALLAQAIGTGDTRQIRLTLATGIRTYLNITLLMILFGVGLGCFITQLVPVKHLLVNELQNGYWLGLLNLLFVPLTPFRLLADASQRGYLANAFLSCQSLLITGTSLFLAQRGFGITGQFLANLCGNIGFQLSMSWDGLRRFPDILSDLRDAKAQSPIMKRIWQLNWPTLAIKLSGQLGLYTDNIIISYSLSPATVVPFFVTQRLAAMAQSHIQNVGNATWAALADLYIKGEKEKFNSRLIELTRLVSVMGLASGIAIIAYNQYFINLWVGSARFGGDGLTILAVCNSLLIGLISLWGWCFSGTGTQARLVVPTTLAASVNFLASIGCTHFFGITGPLMGTFISFITISIWKIPLLLQEVFGTSMKQLFWAVTKPLIFGIPYGVTVWWIAKLHTPWYWLGLAAEIGLSSLIYLVIAWFLVFNDSERTQWSQRLSKLLPSRPKF